MAQAILLTGQERRRRWSPADRLEILEAAFAPGARLIAQMELMLEDAEAAATEDELAAEMAVAAAAAIAVTGFTRKRPVKKPFPEYLPRERVVVPGPVACSCCGGERLRKLGEDISAEDSEDEGIAVATPTAGSGTGGETADVGDLVRTIIVDSTVTTQRGASTTVDTYSMHFPFTVSYAYTNATNVQVSAVTQSYTKAVSRKVGDETRFSSSWADTVKNAATTDFSSGAVVSSQASQQVTYTDSIGSCYDRQVMASATAVTAVTDALACAGKNVLNWLAQPDGAPAQGVLEAIGPD